MKKAALICMLFLCVKSLGAQEAGSAGDSAGSSIVRGPNSGSGSPWIWVIAAAIIIVFLVVLSEKPSKRTKT